MVTPGTVKATLAFVAIVFVELEFPSALAAQAWVPPKGEGNYSISYQNLFVRDHFFSDGSRHDVGHIRLHGMLQELDYGLTEKVAVRISLPFMLGKYKGQFPHVNLENTDDGHYRGTFQDFRFSVRYNLRTRPFVVTPVIEGIVPSHQYEQFAHSAAGFDLRELRLGLSAGRRLNPILPRAFFQTRYSYAVVERHLGVRPNRSIVSSEFTYFMTKRLSLSALETLQLTHSGLNFPQDFPSRADERWIRHAQISKINFLDLGFGAGLAITKSVELFGAALTDAWGENGHALNRGLVFGINWNFRTRRFVGQAFAPESCNVVCRKCQRVFEQPASDNATLTSSLASSL